MTHDSVSDMLDRCTLHDLYWNHFLGPQEQILAVYFSQLNANGINSDLDKYNSQKDAHTKDKGHFSSLRPSQRTDKK